jgi:hypothetical protein
MPFAQEIESHLLVAVAGEAGGATLEGAYRRGTEGHEIEQSGNGIRLEIECRHAPFMDDIVGCDGEMHAFAARQHERAFDAAFAGPVRFRVRIGIAPAILVSDDGDGKLGWRLVRLQYVRHEKIKRRGEGAACEKGGDQEKRRAADHRGSSVVYFTLFSAKCEEELATASWVRIACISSCS